MSQLQIINIRRMSTSIDRNDVIDAWSHWIRILEAFIHGLATNATGILRDQESFFSPVKRQTMGPIMIWTISFLFLCCFAHSYQNKMKQITESSVICSGGMVPVNEESWLALARYNISYGGNDKLLAFSGI